jgi:T4 RnlA family RNA ligase
MKETTNKLPFTIDLLQEMIDANYINKLKHKDTDLYLYNYNASAQYEKVWNEVTLNCRGLILDENFNIIARPFKKFFNYGENQDLQLPLESFEVFEKMDGSLGILYWHNDLPFIATRGSFYSDQALKATELLHNKYKASIALLDRTKTYLFEIIYPQNRIVVNYGTEEMLVLLAIVDLQSGKDYPLVDIGFPVVKKYDGLTDIAALQKLNTENKEGFVLKYESGYRVKVKFEEYLRIHRIITNVSSKTIWENLKNGLPFNEILEKVPDEFYTWVNKTIQNFDIAYKEIEIDAIAYFKTFENRKEAAAYYMQYKHPSILFNMLDKKSYNEAIWQLLKPKYERPFMKSGDE